MSDLFNPKYLQTTDTAPLLGTSSSCVHLYILLHIVRYCYYALRCTQACISAVRVRVPFATCSALLFFLPASIVVSEKCISYDIKFMVFGMKRYTAQHYFTVNISVFNLMIKCPKIQMNNRCYIIQTERVWNMFSNGWSVGVPCSGPWRGRTSVPARTLSVLSSPPRCRSVQTP